MLSNVSTVLARNVVRHKGRGNGGAISVLSTPKGGADKHLNKKNISHSIDLCKKHH